MPCLTRPSSFHTSLPWTKSGDFATANKALTTLTFKEMKMTAVKRNIKPLSNEMGMASQPFRRKRQSGGNSARQQLCNHWRLRCKGAIWCNATREPRQLSATFLCQCEDLEHVMSLTQFQKRLKTSFAAKSLQLWPEMQCEILWILVIPSIRSSSWKFELFVFHFCTSPTVFTDISLTSCNDGGSGSLKWVSTSRSRLGTAKQDS